MEPKDPTMLRKDNTTMYSVENGKVVVHHLPWDRNNKYSAPKFQKLEARGFTYEPPVLTGAVAVAEPPKQGGDNFICPDCGRPCKGQFGLDAHVKVHKSGG